jgi:hypothetical protein
MRDIGKRLGLQIEDSLSISGDVKDEARRLADLDGLR